MDDTKKICLLSSMPVTLWSFYRGLIKQLKDFDFEVTLISSDICELYSLRDEMDCKIFPVKISRQISPLQDIISIFKLAFFLKQKKSNIIHAHTPKGGLIGMVSSWIGRVPVRIYTVHGLPMETSSGLKRKLLWLAEWLSCKLATNILAVSPSLRQRVIDEKLCKDNKINILGSGSACGIDLNRFCPNDSEAMEGKKVRVKYNIPENAIVFGFVGRVVPDKGVKTLVKAFVKLQEIMPESHLLIIGDFEIVRDGLDKETVQIIKNNKHISYNGKFTTDIVKYYFAMDILALPSRREGFGLTLIEAAAMGLPTIATKVTGCVDAVVDNVTGLLVETDNIEQLFGAMLKLSKNSELRKELGQNGKERARLEFSSNVLIAKHIDLYHELLIAT